MIVALAIAASILAADPRPEVCWQRISIGGRPVGYAKTSYVPEGDATRCVEETVVVLDSPTEGSLRQEVREESLFGRDLSPRSFEKVTTLGGARERVTRRVSGSVSGGKLSVVDELDGGSRATVLDVPEGLLSPGACLFLYVGLEEGKAREFATLSTRTRGVSIVKGTVTRTGARKVKDGENEEAAWLLEERPGDDPSLLTAVVFLPPVEGRPNGRVVSRVQTDSKQQVPEMRYESCAQDEAEAWLRTHGR